MLVGHTRPDKQLNNKPFFSSRRERRLWGWTLAVVAAIYSTLGLAATLAGFLRNRGLLDDLFVLGLILIGARDPRTGADVAATRDRDCGGSGHRGHLPP